MTPDRYPAPRFVPLAFSRQSAEQSQLAAQQFYEQYGFNSDGSKRTFYYTQESCGIAAGFFIAAVHQMGLVTLTHTPSPMAFLSELLDRPVNEKAMLVMPVGYPAANAQIPDIARKPLHEIAVWR